MISIYKSPQEYQKCLAGLAVNTQDIAQQVSEIISKVRHDGDRALLEFTQCFDGVALSELRVSEVDAQSNLSRINPALRDIWIEASDNIEQFHLRQREDSHIDFYNDGSALGWRTVPINRIGIYVPGGKAVYPSSVLMSVIPAQVAGVSEIVIVSPPGENGLPHRHILSACALLGIEEIYAVGGAQAIAALAYGTASIKPVNKIVGPGNQYVAEAKRQVVGQVGIDSIAGPSEIFILADATANAEFIARDLLSQAEHDEQARAVLVTPTSELATAVQERLMTILKDVPRGEIIRASFKRASGIVLVDDINHGLDFINDIAPEHLEIMTENPLGILGKVSNAGAVFIGEYTPEAVGDYIAGPSHVLPTAGGAKFSSALGVADFVRRSSVIAYSKERLAKEAQSIQDFAMSEDLPAHAQAVKARFEQD